MGDRPLVLKISEVCALLRISRSAFYRKVCKDTMVELTVSSNEKTLNPQRALRV